MKQEKSNRAIATAAAVLVVAVVLLALDQIIKYFVLADLKPCAALLQ